ncbi:MAG: beta strand repeat-containing protein [Gaiellaceae bacterium]
MLGTEFADHIVVTSKGIFGGGLEVTYRNIQVLEIDALEGDDTIDVLSTPPNMAVRVLGGLGSDTINVAGDVVGDVVAKDVNGSSATINHLVTSTDPAYNDIVAPGINVDVAQQTQGNVIITETNGGTEVRRDGDCNSTTSIDGCALALAALDSYTVQLADQPTSDVWVTVTAAMSPEDQRPGADTLYLCTGAAADCSSGSDYYETVYVDGVATRVPVRALVLHFDASNYNQPQTVWVAAAVDATPQGDIVVAVSHTVVSTDSRYANDIVRNVEVTVHDNLTPGVEVVQTDGNTTVIKGTGGPQGTELTDTFTVAPLTDPKGNTVTYTITPTDAFVILSGAGLTPQDLVNGVPTSYAISFTDLTPVTITVTAVNDFVRTDPHYTTLNFTQTVGTGSGDVHQSLDVLVLDDNTPGVYVDQSGGSTLVSGGTSPVDDSYTLRLLAPPSGTSTVTVGIVTDGQTSIDTNGCTTPTVGEVCLAPVGHQSTKGLFSGNVTISGNTIALATGSELGSFVDDGFAEGQWLVLGGTGTGDDNPCANSSCSNAYLITGVTASTITLQNALPAAGTFGPYATQGAAPVTLSRVVPAGLFAGGVTSGTDTDPTTGASTTVLIRSDGQSWLDNGFLEGQLVQLSGVSGTFKIQSIFGPGLSEMSFTAAPSLPASGTVSVTEYAPVATFDATNWWQPVTVDVSADDAFKISAARADLTTFPKEPHYLSAIRGPLQVDGGTGGEQHTLNSAVILPLEVDTPPYGIAQQPSEAKQIDVLNIYDDGSHEDQTGTLSSTALTGLGMGPDLTFPGTTAFGEPNSFPGGISYGTISVDSDGNFTTDGSVSTIEVLNVMLGQGNDTLNVTGTLQQGADQASDDKLPVGIPSLYGALTLVQGGGNSLLAITGTFDVSATGVTRDDDVSWASAGFAVGQRVNLPGYAAGAFTITGFTGTNGQTMVLSGGTLTAATALAGTVSVYDPLQASTGFERIGGDHIVVTGGGGPNSPLVVYGDTSQDGVWYSGDPNEQAGHVFGPKPTTEPVGNAPNFVFPLAQSFLYAGNDVIDASALDAGLAADALPSIGLVAYGGAGNDTIIGSQTGDILAGGSGDDTIDGLRGNDLIYGDNGINVDVISRVLTVPSVNGSALPNADSLFAGHDLISGDGPGSAPDTTAGATSSQDTIFGDLGTVTQDVQDQRYWYFDGAQYVEVDARPQRLQTTGRLMDLATTSPQNGVSDTISGDLGNDIILGGGGGDTISGNDGNDLAFGDFGSVDCVKHADGSCIAYVDGSLLPFDVPLNDHTFTWTSLTTQQSANWGNDLISGGGGLDILVGGAGSDRISGDAGDDDLIGGNTGLAIQGVPNSGGAGGYNAGVDFSGGDVAYGDVYGFTGGFPHAASGGFDGGHSACVAAAYCTYGDYLDGGSGNDVVAGDNATILRTGSTVGPRFRVLTGTDIFDTTDGSANVAGQSFGALAPCAWVDGSGAYAMACQADSYQWQADPLGAHARSITLYDQQTDVTGSLPAGTYSDSDLAGGSGNDVLFGQGGNDWIQGDSSVIDDSGHVTVDVQTRDTVTDPRTSVEDLAGPGADGADYVEGNAGNDVIYGDLGQDDLVGGSSNMFSLTAANKRSDGSDTIEGGAGTRNGIDDQGDLSAAGHAHDADTILGDNGDIFRLVGADGSAATDANGATKSADAFLTFNYDNYDTAETIVPRAWTLLDYTYGTTPTIPPLVPDVGGADLLQGESGDDVILGETGDDVVFGGGQDDTLIGGNGSDRIYGGAGDDAILGDNGYYEKSRNGLTEPLWDVTTPNATDVVVSIPGPFTDATTFQAGDLFNEARLFDYDAADPTAAGFADIVYAGLGNDWVHGEGGDDAISGAEALPFYYSTIPQSEILAQWGIDPADPLAYDPSTTKFADYNADDPWSKIYDCTDGTKDVGVAGTCASGQKVDFFLNFTPYVLNANGQPTLDGSGNVVKSNDGCDIVYGDNGNDWIVGGTDTNWLFGGFGDDLLQSSQNLETDNELNRVPEDATWSDPTFAYGGAGRDVLIADTGRARMYDWSGEFNSFVVPFSPFGAPVVNRSFSPWVRDFIKALSVAGGADQTFTPDSPLDELALSTPQDSYWNAQHGGPRDPQPGNVAGVGIDYRGNVDVGVGCPCDQGDAIAVQGEVNGQIEEVAPGLVVPVGTAITFTYSVTNPRSQSLAIVSITDDNGTPFDTSDDFTPVYVSGDTNGNGLLDPGETWIYTSAGAAGAPTQAAAGGHQDTVNVVGYDAVKSVQVTAADVIDYTGTTPALEIGKDVNAADPLHPSLTAQADTAATGPTLPAGAPIVFTFRVWTTGSTPLTVTSITDTIPADASDVWSPLPVLVTFLGQQYNVGDTNFDNLLDPGEVWLYTSVGAAGAPTTAEPGVNEDFGNAFATDGTTSYTAQNAAYYTGTTGIGLVKAVNAVDPLHPTPAEDANGEGPIVAVGSTVIFSYLVVNSSNSAISVTDIVDDDAGLGPAVHIGSMTEDMAGGSNVGDANRNGALDPGESWVWLWTTTAALKTHTNTATVTAIDGGGKTIAATDTAQYTGAGAHITLQTAIDALHPTAPTVYEDADTPPGAYLNVGAQLTYTYLVANDGFLQLNAPTLADSSGKTPTFVSGDTNGNGLLDIGETWLYTLSAGKALSGTRLDTSSASATPTLAGADGVSSNDPTYYTGFTEGIVVEKAVDAANPLNPTAAEDANDATQPYYVLAGSTVTFTYLVDNTTRSGISGIVLTDDGGVPGTTAIRPTLVSGDKNGNGVLDKNEVWLYRYTTTALPGLNGNLATVTAGAYGSTDAAWYFGVTDGITIKKATNAADPLHPTVLEEGDTPQQELYLDPGAPVMWTYRVTNTGNSSLEGVTISDTSGTFPLTLLSGDNGNGLLDPGETWLYTSAPSVYDVVAGQYLSSATVTATDTKLGAAVSASDASDHFGAINQLVVTKAVNAVDQWHPTIYELAQAEPGPVVPVGSSVTWSYLVTNQGSTSLDVSDVMDDLGTGDPNQAQDVSDGFVGGDTNNNGTLDPGETWLYTFSGVAPLGQYKNTVVVDTTVLGEPTPTPLPATAFAYLYGTPPGIQVVKLANGQPAESAANPLLVASGSTVTYTFQVTATTSTPVSNVTIDDPGLTLSDVSGDTNNDHVLQQGETWIYTATLTQKYGLYENVVDVSGQAGGVTVKDDDRAYTLGVVPGVTIVKAVDALDPYHPTATEDANSQPAKELLVGTTAVWTYLITNTGNAAVAITSLVDDNGTPTNAADDFTPTCTAGDTNGNQLLDVGETWLCSATTTVQPGPYENTVNVLATQPATGQTATDGDVAGYYGDTSAEGLSPGYWKNHTDGWPAFTPTRLVSTVFGPIPAADASETLLDAVSRGGGGTDALLRAAVAALLNTSSQTIAYPWSATQLVQAVDAALAGGDTTAIGSLQVQLDSWNNLNANLTPPDTTPAVSIGNVSLNEGNDGQTSTATFTLTLSFAPTAPVTVDWATADGTAAAPGDYTTASGSVTFAAGQTTASLGVTVNGDNLVEPDETFTVVLSNPQGLTIGTGTGTATIVNDDIAPTVTIAATDASGAEQGSDPIVFTVSRSGDTSGTLTIGLGWSGSATLGADYAVTASGGALAADDSTLTFAAGSANATVTVTPVDDTSVEGTESVTLTLSAGSGYTVGASASATGTIADNDVATGPTLSIGSAQVTEGDRKTSNVTLTVKLSAPSTKTVAVTASTVDGSADAGSDYVAKTATLTFKPGATTATFQVAIVGDKVAEPTETFSVVLSNASGATIATGTATVTIVDNDHAMFASAPAPAGTVVDRPLTEAALAPVLARAEAAWTAAVPGASFDGVTVTIADLAGDLLGYTLGKSVTIDPTADGWGWSAMYPDDPAPRMDLLSVLLHELGLTLGYSEADPRQPAVMARTLTAGVGPQTPPTVASQQIAVAGAVAVAGSSEVAESRLRVAASSTPWTLRPDRSGTVGAPGLPAISFAGVVFRVVRHGLVRREVVRHEARRHGVVRHKVVRRAHLKPLRRTPARRVPLAGAVSR